MTWIGSRWWKFDFHNHTPISDDYGKGSKQEEYKKILPKDWLLNYMRAGIDCVAITDHNSGAWIDLLQQALSDLSTEGHPDYRPLYLFPGVEITVQGNIHILAILPLDKSTSDVDTLLGLVDYGGTKGSSDGCTVLSAVAVIEKIIKFGGIAIPAHVDQPRGLFKEFSGNTLDQVLSHKDVFSIEVTDHLQPKPSLYNHKNLRWAEVLGSDSHHPNGVAGQHFPGSHFTWVKMSQPSLDGLRLALIDGAFSLKRSDQFVGNPNTHGQLFIENIIVDNARYLGKGDSFDCQFNPWLNTVIGGRGTGKSTILEFLRITLKRKDEIPKNLENEFLKYSKTSNNRQDDGLLENSTVLKVVFRKDGSRFRIRWVNLDNIYLIEEETSPNTWSPAEGNITQRFPVRIYSQKQIFELAKHPQALLQIIDDSLEVNHHDWKLEWDELVSKYLSLRAQEREVQTGLQEESSIKGQLEDVKRKLEVFEKSGHASILKNYQLRQNQGNSIDSWEKSWAGYAEQLQMFSGSLSPAEIDTQHFSIETKEDKELLDAVFDVQSSFQAMQVELQKLAKQIEETYKSWQEGRLTLGISQKITESNQEYTRLLEELANAGVDEPSVYGQLVKQRQHLEEKLKSFDKKRETLSQHKKNAEECLIKIHEHRKMITELRSEFLKKILAGNLYVKIDVVPYANKATVEEEFRNLINRENGGFDRDIGTIDGEEGILSILTKELSLTMEQRVATLKTKIFAINANDNASVATAKDKRFVSHIQELTSEQVDRIHCWFPEDSLDVQYGLKGVEFKPLEQGSPGQKTAALLAFILSYGNEPLILDQPEDDLDNHLIYDMIVTQLRDIKQHRQILIITHNSNIVVNGDAENVVVLDVKRGQTRIIAQGGLQEPSIRNEICRVMEGGKEAFDQRYRRISIATV